MLWAVVYQSLRGCFAVSTFKFSHVSKDRLPSIFRVKEKLIFSNTTVKTSKPTPDRAVFFKCVPSQVLLKGNRNYKITSTCITQLYTEL
jgi:hypothetical protein